MCQLCGCGQYIEQGKEAVLKRSVEIIKELGITARNAVDYEDTEVISRLIAPFGSSEDDVYRTAVWVSNLHMGMSRGDRSDHYQAHIRAFQDIFSRLPARGEPKHIATTYHQLEQLGHELDETDLASLDSETREALQAVNNIHGNLAGAIARLKQRYGL